MGSQHSKLQLNEGAENGAVPNGTTKEAGFESKDGINAEGAEDNLSSSNESLTINPGNLDNRS